MKSSILIHTKPWEQCLVQHGSSIHAGLHDPLGWVKQACFLLPCAHPALVCVHQLYHGSASSMTPFKERRQRSGKLEWVGSPRTGCRVSAQCYLPALVMPPSQGPKRGRARWCLGEREPPDRISKPHTLYTFWVAILAVIHTLLRGSDTISMFKSPCRDSKENDGWIGRYVMHLIPGPNWKYN